MAASRQPSADSIDSTAAVSLVRETVANEVAASARSAVKHLYLTRKETPREEESELYVETTDATAGLTIEKNGKPVSGVQLQEENSRLQKMCRSPNELRRKQRQEREENEHELRIMKAFPDAFVYQFDGTEPGRLSVGKSGDTLIRLKFSPNPAYSAPSHIEEVLGGMQGTLLIDREAHRIARIDATLFREVSFGWGILGHLDKGGTFLVEQADVGGGAWELTHMRLSFTGKVMMVKSLVIKSDETSTDFHAVPSNTNFAEGIDLLKSENIRLQKEEADRRAANFK